MIEVPLHPQGVTLIDDEDFDIVAKYNWYRIRGSRGYTYYALGHSHGNYILLHRLLMNPNSNDITLDHINRNGLDNRRENLRLATPSQQSGNQKLYSNNKTGYRGVRFSKERNKYRATIHSKHLGYFDNLIEAVEVYEKAAREYYGEFYVSAVNYG